MNTLPQMALGQVCIPIGYDPEEYWEESTSLSMNKAYISMKSKNNREAYEQYKGGCDTVCDVIVDGT